MGKYRTRELTQRVRYALLAGVAGAFLIPQVAFAAPTGEDHYTPGVNVDHNTANTTKITSTATNNVINWRDYSVNQGEIVQYDGGVTTGAAAHNYLNIVTGANTSNINGKIEGGKDVYIVNPNGVIFGKTASVNVGNLYVSTQDGVSSTAKTAFESAGTSPLVNNATLKADVVNMGKITADTVEVHGAHIRFLNAADVKTSGGTLSSVDMYTAPAASSVTDPDGGYAHIGYRGSAPSNYTPGNATSATPEYYQLVKDKTELDAINSSTATLAGKYMLEDNIDLGGATHTPIGGNGHTDFTGKFDGNFFQVKNFTIPTGTGAYAGLFGKTTGARIENLGVVNATIMGNNVGGSGGAVPVNFTGGIVAHATGSTLKNVYTGTGVTLDGEDMGIGGIAGYTNHTSIDSAYSKATIGEGGGIIGWSDAGTVVTDSYSDVKIRAGASGTYFVYLIDPAAQTTIKNSYAIGSTFTWVPTAPGITNSYTIDKTTGKATPFGSTTAVDAHVSSSYSGWDINNNGAPGAKWRIYEGRTTPMLTAFMNGTATATYKYRYFNADGSADTDTGNTDKSNEGKDLTGLTYNSKYLKIVNPNAPTAAGDKSNVIYSGDVVDNNKVHDYVNTGTKDYDKTNGIRNAGTKAILWSDQDGPNLRGVNVTIDKRQVKLNNGNINPKRMYNGKKDVTDAFIQALKSGNITSNGFTQDDINAGSVQLDFTTGNFKAQMADKNVGTDKEVTFTGSIRFSGADKGNYEFDGGSINNLKGKATITKAPLYLNIIKKEAANKIYDGTSTVVDDAMKQSTSPKNITLNVSTQAPLTTDTDQTIPDGAVMRDESNNLDDVGLKNILDPKYTDAEGNEEIHAGGRKLQYKDVGFDTTKTDTQNYELFYKDGATKTKVTDETLYLEGKIVSRQISRDAFKVYKSDGTEASAQKVYDGNSTFTPEAGTYLSSNAVASGSTGIVSRDQGHITFGLTGGANFTDNSGNATKNVKTASKIAYKVTGQTDDADEYRLTDYYIMDGSPVVKKSLDQEFSATGAGKITPKALTATVVNNHITKVYDAMDDQTDGSRQIIKSDALVTLSGFVGSESRPNTSTAKYASKNVVVDGSGNPTTQSVTYTASFDAGTGAESENYTLGTEGVKPIVSSKTLTDPSYKGTITPRTLTMTFNDVTKVYDGTDTNTNKTLASLNDGLSGAVVGADGITTANFNMSGVTSRYGTGGAGTFAENVNAGNRTVEYAGLSNALGTTNHNYKIADKQYGTGTITRRRIDKSGFRVYNADHTVADAAKVYDGNNRHTLAPGAYLTGTAASGDTGIVTRDYGKVTFALKTGSTGHFSSDADGNNRTSHVSEAKYVAYDVVARTSDATNNPLTNYTFGSAAEETGGTLRNLETVNDTKPAHVTAAGHITSASIRAKTHAVEKVYDGVAEHTDGNRNIKRGSDIVSLATMITDETDGQPTNTSTATYADKNVSRDASGNIIKKAVSYTAQLTGKYADDYKIVDAGNTVISTVSGTGANKTLTANAGTVTNAGKITPRKLNIKMGDVSKTYDGTSTNTDSSVTEITDAPQTAVIGTILTGDGITTGALKTAWDNKRSGGTASSSYGNGTGSAFRQNANASNGTPHDVRYTKMDEAFKDAFGTTAAGNYTVDKTVYGKGTINRKAIDTNNFDIVDAHGNASHATKVYDGTSNYTVPSGWNLRPSTGHGTGVVAADADKISFAIDPNRGAHFTKADNTTRTANVDEAQRVAYNVKATADSGYEYLLKNYTLNGQNLESGNATATGAGRITRRTINIGLAEASGIDKVYDGNANLIDTANRHHQTFADVDGRANVGYATGTTNANKLVRTKNGYSVDDSAQVTVQGSYADKNVARSGGNVTTKSITYNVKIAGDAGKNYYLTDGSTTVNAEDGMNLSATGTITPRDLSGAFKKVTKVYDGTKNVDPSKVGFEIGANGVVSGDAVGLASGHTQEFESENVRGSGTTWTAPDGTRQHNWVNYSNLSLTGADAGNYTLSLGATAKGLGEITPLELNPSTVTLVTTQATKEYDGGVKVKKDGSDAISAIKNYITDATVTVGSAPAVDILGDLKLEEAKYDTKDVDGGNATDRVTYKLSYTGTNGNFSLGTGVTSFTTKGDGVITKKDVTATVKSPLTKIYDATHDVVGVAKNNAKQVVANASDNITLDGLVAGDGTTYTTTAAYADENAGDNKRIDYTLNFTTNGGNYNLKYNSVDNAGAFSTNNNTITKRKVDVQFKNPPARTYNGSAENTAINPFVSSADAAVLSKDKQTLISGTDVQNLAGIASKYVQNDRVTEDPNAGKDKLVRFDNVRTAMNNALGADASNYEFNETAYAKGTINKANIDTSKITFRTSGATKTYDGTDRVKYNGSSAMADVKNYITTATADLGGGHTADLRGDLVIDEKETRYVSADAGTNIGVKYKFRLNNSNIEISGKNEFEMPDTGEIKRRVLNLDLAQKSGIDKIYDTTKIVHNTDERHYDAFADDDAKGNVVYAAGTTEDTKIVRKAGNPETTVKVTAVFYADENAGTRNVNYTVRIEEDAGKNYTLKYGATEGDAETGINFAATGTIAKRKLTLGFDKASKQYDTLADNPDRKKLLSAIADNSDARGVDTLNKDGILAADGTVNTGAFNTTNVASEYGTRSNDPANPFTPDPNVGTKDVRYTNVKSALSGAKAGNYEIVDTVYGTGEITRAKIKAADFDFQIDPSKKTYDGTTNVYWKDQAGQWQEAKGEEGLDGAKKYYFGDRSTIKLANGQRVKVNPADFSLTEAAYQNKNVAGGTETWTDADGNTYRNWVNYKLHINTTNFDVEGERDTTRKGVGTISKRDLATMLPKHLIKEYDGQQTFDETNRDYVNALANENITHIVKEDQGKIQLKVEGTYSDKDASAETKANAQNGVHLSTAPNGRTVDYKLTLSGDADTLANYTIDGHDTTHTVTGRAADIYKKTLTVDVERKVKDYDGTAAVNNLTKNDVTLKGMVNNESLKLDDDSIKKVKGQYLDSAGNPDANVSRDANRKVLYKAVEYTGLNDALNDLAARDAKAKNYRVEDGSKSYTADDEKGRIDPLKVNDPSNDVKMEFAATGPSKTYDRETTVKYKGLGTKEALKNYLTDATVMVGGQTRSIKDEIEIDPTKTHYDDKNAGTGKTVTYGFKYKGNNFEVADFTKESDVKGEINRKDVKVFPVGQLWKEYDGTPDVYVEGDDSIFTRRGGKQGERVTTGDSVLRLENGGLIAGDRVTNTTTAFYDTTNVGTGKTVTYTPSLSGADAANYRLVHANGTPITPGSLSTSDNTIAKRTLDISFDGLPHVQREYNAETKNDNVTARLANDPNGHTRTVLGRDGLGVVNGKIVGLDHTNIESDFGYGSTDDTFRADANADVRKDVQYRGIDSALRNLLGNKADNYEFKDKAYSDGAITHANLTRNDFDLKFGEAPKEYDGTKTVVNPAQYLNRTTSQVKLGGNWHALQDGDVVSVTGEYANKNAAASQPVTYKVKFNTRNFNITDDADNTLTKSNQPGEITKRKLIADPANYLTKEYDGTTDIIDKARNAHGDLITAGGDNLVKFHHYSGTPTHPDDGEDTVFYKDAAAGTVSNVTTADYVDKNVEWQGGVWNQGRGVVGDKNVKYTVDLTGTDAANYDIVHADGTAVTPTNPYVGKGKITPKEIVLKADPQERWINEGLPTSYTGTPMGKNLSHNEVPEIVPSDTPLPGTITYSSPNARLRVGYYAVEGTYHAPNGADGDSVSWNYRFIQDPANDTALYIGPYIPDYEYYKAMTQVSKMTPDEYAYENASLDRTNHYSRKPSAQVDPVPPAINVVKDGVDIRQNDINVLDDTVYTIVDEVFG